MKTYISHRGNLIGPFPDLENRPDYILNALDSGFECECDVWWWGDGWWLGHDRPQYKTDFSFLLTPKLWLHAKNLEALERLRILELNCFSHDNDPYVFTSKGHIWAYPGSRLSKITVCVMPENADPLYSREEKELTWAICSDYVVLEKLQEIRRNT